jgi:hypothetical protein
MRGGPALFRSSFKMLRSCTNPMFERFSKRELDVEDRGRSTRFSAGLE